MNLVEEHCSRSYFSLFICKMSHAEVIISSFPLPFTVIYNIYNSSSACEVGGGGAAVPLFGPKGGGGITGAGGSFKILAGPLPLFL